MTGATPFHPSLAVAGPLYCDLAADYSPLLTVRLAPGQCGAEQGLTWPRSQEPLPEMYHFVDLDAASLAPLPPLAPDEGPPFEPADDPDRPSMLRSSSISTDSDRSTEATTKLRRRAQNRASQRAFRQRKENHLRSLKLHLDTLGDKHSRLLTSYAQQADVVLQLRRQIAHLTAEIGALESPTDRALGAGAAAYASAFPATHPPRFEPFDTLDAFSLPAGAGSFQRHSPPPLHHHGAPVAAHTLPTLDDLPGFEDLLKL